MREDIKEGLQSYLNVLNMKVSAIASAVGSQEEVDIADTTEGNPVVAGAQIQCSEAVNSNARAYVYARTPSHDSRNGNIGLKDTDIKFIPPTFGICKRTNGLCRPIIENERWNCCDSSDTIAGRPSVKMHSLMVCMHGFGLITLTADGQEAGKESQTTYAEIVDLKTTLYELAEQGGIEAVQEFIDGYYTEDLWNYLNDIGQREGSGNYNIVSDKGTFLGKYQLGYAALEDIGWLNEADYSSGWTDKAELFGVNSKEDFLNNGTAQEVAMALYLRVEYMTLKQKGVPQGLVGTELEGYIRVKNPNDNSYEKKMDKVEVTLSGLMAASHLVGMGKISNEYQAGGDFSGLADENNTYATEYMYDFAGHDDVKKLLGYVSSPDDVGIE